jgi:hypothetical protein
MPALKHVGRASLLLATVLLLGAKPTPLPIETLRTDAEGVLVSLKSTQGNIMPAEFVAKHPRHDPPLPGEKVPAVRAWTPRVADIARFERDLAPFLLQSLRAYSPNFPEAEVRKINQQHLRQYYGVIVKGRKHLHVEVFEPRMALDPRMDGSPMPSWRTRQFQVVDAASDYVWIDYDVRGHQFLGLGMTGEP